MGSPHRIYDAEGTETLFTIRTCCHETHNYVVCTCNTLQPFSPNDSKLISVESLHGHFKCDSGVSYTVGVSSVRWIRSHMEDWPVLLITHFAWKWQRISLWARSTSSEGCQRMQRSPHGGTTPFMNTETQALIDTMDLVQNVILQTEYHLLKHKCETNLARKTATDSV